MNRNNNKLENLYKYLKENKNEKMMDFLNMINNNKAISNKEIFYDILYDFIYFQVKCSDSIIQNMIKIYNMLNLNRSDKIKLHIFKEIITDDYMKYIDDEYIIKIYDLFSNKLLFLSILKYIDEVIDLDNNLTYYLYKYLYEAKKYYIDERSLYSSTINFINQIMIDNCNKDIIIEKELEKDRMISGSYTLDEENFIRLNDFFNKRNKLEDEVDESCKIIDNLFCNVDNVIKEYQLEVEESINYIKKKKFRK